MNDFGYSEEQLLIATTVRDFARKEVAPGAAERDRTGVFDAALYRRLGDLGIPGMLYPAEVGGTDAGTLAFCLVIEELARADMSLALVLWVGAGAARNFVRGTPEQREAWTERYVVPMVRGEIVGSTAITEPDAGSDTAAIRTRARREGDDWVLDGSKMFISNAGLDICPFVTVLARTDSGFGLFVVPRETPGYTMGPPLRKMGLRSADTRELAFESCRVPGFHLLGGAESGRDSVVGGGFALTRIYMAAQAQGLAMECLDASLGHARSRTAFKRPIGQFQHVQAMLVDMHVGIEAGRHLRDHAARLNEARRPHVKEAAVAKLYCTEMAKRASDHAVQVFGGLGFMEGTPVERYYRDVRALTIAEGTSQIQQHIIARELGALGGR